MYDTRDEVIKKIGKNFQVHFDMSFIESYTGEVLLIFELNCYRDPGTAKVHQIPKSLVFAKPDLS
jgi:hypothetical protein